MKKVWFAEKLDGEIIHLNEKEALIHFQDNNISQRMRLKFLGTSDGKTFSRVLEEGKHMKEKAEQNREKANSLDAKARLAERGGDREQAQEYRDEARDLRQEADDLLIVAETKPKEAFEAELEIAKQNGVEEPDRTLDIITPRIGGGSLGGEVSSAERRKIINSM